MDMQLLKDKDVLGTCLQVEPVEVQGEQEGNRSSIPNKINDNTSSTVGSDLTPDSFNGLLENLNFTSGVAGDFTLDLVQHLKRSLGVHQAQVKRKAEADATQQRFDDFMKDQRLTAGVIFKYNKVVLDGDILNY